VDRGVDRVDIADQAHPFVNTMKPSFRPFGSGVTFWVLVAVWAVLTLTLLVAIPTEARFTPDSSDYTRPARILAAALQGDETSAMSAGRPLLYPVVIATAMLVDTNFVPLVVGFQMGLLLLTAWIAGHAAERHLPGHGIWVFALMLANPNGWMWAQLVLSDTLFAFLFTAAFAAGLAWLKQPRWPVAVLLGLLLGAASLTRVEPKYLVYLLPLALPLLAWAGGAGRLWLRHLAAGVLVVLLWQGVTASGHTIGESVFGASDKSWAINDFLRDNLHWLLYYQDTSQSFESMEAEVLSRVKSFRDAHCTGLTRDACAGAEFNFLLASMAGQDPGLLLYAAARASLTFFVGADSSVFQELLDWRPREEESIFWTGSDISMLTMIKHNFSQAHPAGIALTVSMLGFALVMRLAGLVGLFALVRWRRWDLLLLLAAVIAYMATVHLFLGRSRYRLPAEMPLLMLAVSGFVWMRVWLGTRRTA